MSTLTSKRTTYMSKWVFKVIENVDGTVHKFNARLVKGFHQVAGFDFHETFSPDVKPTTIGSLLLLLLQIFCQ